MLRRVITQKRDTKFEIKRVICDVTEYIFGESNLVTIFSSFFDYNYKELKF